MSEQTARQAVRDTIQAGYGDATQTVLDDRVAGDVVKALRERGWVSLDELAMILDAAGGQVRVTHEHMVRGLAERHVEVYDDPATGDRIVRLVARTQGAND